MDAGIRSHAANHFANATVNSWPIGIAIVLTNLAGHWQLPGKAQERKAHAKAREERKYWEEAAKPGGEGGKQEARYGG